MLPKLPLASCLLAYAFGGNILLNAAAVTITATATPQASVSRIPSIKKLGLQVSEVLICADYDIRVPAGRIIQALASQGVQVESTLLAPYIAQTAQDTSVLGRVITAGETGGGLLAVLSAAGIVGIGGPWAVAPPLAAMVARTARDKQGKYLGILIPLLGRLMDPAGRLDIQENQCESRFVFDVRVNKGLGKPRTAVIRQTVPDKPGAPVQTSTFKDWHGSADLLLGHREYFTDQGGGLLVDSSGRQIGPMDYGSRITLQGTAIHTPH